VRRLVFWFDPVSPFAYLAFEHLPQALQGLSYEVQYRPVLFAGLLGHWGQKGPAEIAPKRDWTFRDVAWHARELRIELQMPASHPFNPLPLLRLALACGDLDGTPNRRVVEALFRHVWRGGGEPAEPQRLQALRLALAPARDPDSPEVKAALRAATDEAIARGIFGVPSIELDGRVFWGVDALPMVAACLRGDPWFDDGGPWQRAGQAPPGVQRRPASPAPAEPGPD
jgi:2-hydroxychromene-2-carboxylate isomerase